MKKSKKIFNYQNQIILTNGSSLKITSVKYILNYQFNNILFKEKKKKDEHLKQLTNSNQFNFIKKIK
jgi:hypothetical protein